MANPQSNLRVGVAPAQPVYPAAQFPLIQPTPVTRVDYRAADGTVISQIRDDERGIGYQFIRKLRDALMGKVKQAVRCSRIPGTADWAMVANAEDPSLPPPCVAVKQLYKECIIRGLTLQGHRVKENPLQEIGVLLHLSGISAAAAAAAAGGAGAVSVSPFEGGHPNVLRILDLCEDQDCVYIVLEFLPGGELFDAVDQRKVDEPKARRFFSQMVAGAAFCHAAGVGHRDVSLENALLSGDVDDEESEAKIIDFGLATKIPPRVHQNQPGLLAAEGRIGKERYMAPEVFRLSPYDPVAVDTWELGVCLFLLLFGVYPYKQACADICPYFRGISEGSLPTLLHEWEFDKIVSPAAIDLLVKLLQIDPLNRMSLFDVAVHPWLTGAAFYPPQAAAAVVVGVGGGDEMVGAGGGGEE